MNLNKVETIRETIADLNRSIGSISEDMKALQKHCGGVCVLNPTHEAYRLSEIRFNLLRQRNELQRKLGH